MALARYEALTGHAVSGCRFRVLRDDCAHGWLGASPDGLIDGLTATPGQPLSPKCLSRMLCFCQASGRSQLPRRNRR